MDEIATFELKKQHIKLVKRLKFCTGVFLRDDYFGTDGELRPEVNLKRPFGNSDLIGDVLQIAYGRDTGDEPSAEEIQKAKQLVIELPLALEIILQKQTFEPGVYAVEKGPAWLQYQHLSKYLILEPALAQINQDFPDEGKYPLWKERLSTIALNLSMDDPWEEMGKEIAFARKVDSPSKELFQAFLDHALLVLQEYEASGQK